MSKTPEQLAADYCEPILSDEYARAIGREDWIGTRCVRVGEAHEMYKAFLAGYKAAKDQQFLGAKPDQVLIDEPELAADADKVMPLPEAPKGEK